MSWHRLTATNWEDDRYVRARIHEAACCTKATHGVTEFGGAGSAVRRRYVSPWAEGRDRSGRGGRGTAPSRAVLVMAEAEEALARVVPT